MATSSLTTLLNEANEKINQYLYVDALRIIREAKIVDLSNLYIAGLEQFVTKLSHITPQDLNFQNTTEYKQVFTIMMERALENERDRTRTKTHAATAIDERTLEKEKVKNLYFQRTDELLEKREYIRALEEVRRVYYFDAANIVAREYEQKLEKLIELEKNRSEP